MNYSYDITKKDSFYNNWNVKYFKYKDDIIALKNYGYKINKIYIKTFNINTKQFTSNEKLTYVEYENLKDITYLYNDLEYGIVVDIANKQWSNTTKYPYFISEIDGNAITICKLHDKFYIFHSHTENYETGVFIFDIKNNTFNNSDFRLNELYHSDDSDDSNSESEMVPVYTNTFKNLHDKTVYYSCVNDNQIILNIEDDIYKYDGELTDLNLKSDFAIKVSNNMLYGLYKNKVNIYNIHSKNLIKTIEICDDNEQILYWEIYNDQLIIICEKYVNPYGQIYKETHNEEFKSRNMKIKSYSL